MKSIVRIDGDWLKVHPVRFKEYPGEKLQFKIKGSIRDSDESPGEKMV